jgi:hypothetical protein
VPAFRPTHLSSGESGICPEAGTEAVVPSFPNKVREKRDKRDKSPHAFLCAGLPVLADWGRSASVSSGLGWPQAGFRWCGVFQVVKAAQSRGRPGRTLFTALSQNESGASKGRVL